MSTREIDEWSDRLFNAARSELRGEAYRRLVALALFAEGEGKENATGRPVARTKRLRDSTAGVVRGNPTSETMDMALTAGGRVGGEDVPHAGVQEFGATTRPRRAKWLAIPSEHAKTAAGVAQGGPRDFDLRFVPLGPDRAMLVERLTGKVSRQGRPMFWLRKRVDVPATRFLGRAFDATMPHADRQLGDIGAEVL